MIIEFNQLQKLREENKDKIIALCHGVFAFLHAGHIEHFYWAKSQADILVVSVTGDDFVDAQRSKLFPIANRVSIINELKFVDYIVVSNFPTAVDILTVLKPDVYVKGNEYQLHPTSALMEESRYCQQLLFSPTLKYASSTEIAAEITEAIDIYTDKERIDCILYSLARYKFVYRLLNAGWTVLDCGCGYGYGTKFLSKSGANVTGCDINKLCIDTSKYHFPSIDFIHNDIMDLEFQPFDVIICMELIEHIENVPIFLQRIRGLTKRFAVFSTPKEIPFEKRSAVRKMFHLREYSYQTFKEILQSVFNTVLIFTQTDEIVSVGNPDVAWTYIAICF